MKDLRQMVRQCIDELREGRLTEQSSGIQDLRAGQWETTARIDRLFLAILGIGAAQIGLLITLVVRVT